MLFHNFMYPLNQMDTGPRPGFWSKFGQGLSNYGQLGVGNQMMGGMVGNALHNYLNKRRMVGSSQTGINRPYGMSPPGISGQMMTPSFMQGNTGFSGYGPGGLPPPNLGPAGGMISNPDMNTGISQLWQRYRQQPGMMV